ncbi:recombinase family protein [Methylobacterium sp. ID0610]|uniref:recombinase family protein n=1 Tax=Methylobacterium carpenticola TaxID=3344827 RepID=UPI00369AA374
MTATMPRCAIYTRKSTEDGLDKDFSSLDAQRAACAAYIASQAGEGWIALPDLYDDGGWSGGTLQRPALQRLLADVAERRLDVIVVYKIDRLSRSLFDFSRLVELLDRHGVSFVAVTQPIATTTSMGRLMLNVLLSFAQFEREVIGERVRDKVKASRMRGLWLNGHPPYGYRIVERRVDRRLAVVPAEAAIVRQIFEAFTRLRSATAVARALAEMGAQQRNGSPFTASVVRKALRNRHYRGDSVHRGMWYVGTHEAIVPPSLWDAVHAPPRPLRRRNPRPPGLLSGLAYGPGGRALIHTSTLQRGRHYRYYASTYITHGDPSRCPVGRLRAEALEDLVLAWLDRVANAAKAPSAVDPRERILLAVARIDVDPGGVQARLHDGTINRIADGLLLPRIVRARTKSEHARERASPEATYDDADDVRGSDVRDPP